MSILYLLVAPVFIHSPCIFFLGMAGVGLGGTAAPLLTLLTLLPWLVEEGEHPLSLRSTHHFHLMFLE